MSDQSGPNDTPLRRALAIAEHAHSDQTDKLGAPYVHHVWRVVDCVADLAPAISSACQTAAAPHDHGAVDTRATR